VAWFWFLLCIVLIIILAARKGSGSNEEYGRGYWDGYRALGDKIQDQLDKDHIDRQAIQSEVDRGYGGLRNPAAQFGSDEVSVEDESVFGDGSALAGYSDTQPASAYASDVSVQAAVAAEARNIDSGARSLQNLNTILYMASFLLVAAASAFIATAMPSGVRLVGLVVIVVLFYGAGWVLYKTVARLRPAATAFIGTGLAILPFIGVALHLLGGVPEATAWLAISAIGLIAYIAAAILLQSQVVSYLTMAFVLSLVSSTVASASLPILWYFIALIGVSLIANSISMLKPTLLPEVFRRPIESTGQLVTPLALVASLLVGRLSLDEYEIIFGVATAHYLVVWLQQKTMLYESVARALASITLLIVAWDISAGNIVHFGVWWLVIMALHAAYSLVRVRPGDASSRVTENGWLITAATLILFGMVYWTASEHAALWTTVSLVVVGVISAASLLRLRDTAWGYVGLAVSAILPFVIGRWLIEPALPWSVLVGCFVVLGAAALALYRYVAAVRSLAAATLFMTATLTYIGLTVLSGVFSGDAIVAGWALALASLILIGLSYSGRYIWAEIIAAVFSVGAVALWIGESSIEKQWLLTATIAVSAGLLAAGSFAHHLRSEADRRNYLMIIAMTVVAGLVFNFQSAGSVVIAQTSLILLIAAAFLSYGLRMATRQKSAMLQTVFTFGYLGYALLAWIISLSLSSGWQVLVYGIAALLLWLASYVEKMPPLVLPGNVALIIAIMVGWRWLEFDSEWAVFGVAWLVAAVFYGAYWLMVERRDIWRQWACLGSFWAVLGMAVLMQFFSFDDVQRIAAAATLVVGAGTLGIHGYLFERRGLIEASVYVATFGLQRLVGLAIPEVDMVFYAHWWALTLGLVAWWRGAGHRVVRLTIAMSLITASTGLLALAGDGMYQLLFLAEHLALLVAGAFLQKRWAVWWGIIAAVLAILYFLREYTFLWLGFLGLFLIGIVVWRLMRSGR
jgi:hypothetical protein